MLSALEVVLQKITAKLNPLPLDTMGPAECSAAMVDSIATTAEIKELNFESVCRAILSPGFDCDFDRANPNRYIVVKTPVYFIEMLLWSDQHTSVHNHSFTGTVCVLDGKAVNVNFDYQLEGSYRDMTWGQLTPQLPREAPVGHYFAIAAHKDFIHKVFHLTKRCCSLRIGLSRGLTRQFTFHSPGVGILQRHGYATRLPFRLEVLREYFDRDKTIYAEMLDRLMNSPLAEEILGYLLVAQTGWPSYDFFGKHLAPLNHFPAEFRAKIAACMKVQPLENGYEGIDESRPNARLLVGILNLVGFRPGSAAYFTKWHGPKASTWLRSTLFELAVSRSITAPVARLLIEVWSRRSRGLDTNIVAAGMAPIPFAAEYEATWQISRFTQFLAELERGPLNLPLGQPQDLAPHAYP